MIALQEMRVGNHSQLIDSASICLEWNTVYFWRKASFPIVSESGSILTTLPPLSVVDCGTLFYVELVNDEPDCVVNVSFFMATPTGRAVVHVNDVNLQSGKATPVFFTPEFRQVVVDAIRIDRVR